MNSKATAALIALVVGACGGGGEAASDGATGGNGSAAAPAAGPAAASPDPASVPADRAGTFELEGTEYPFLVVRCDLTGDSPDGMLLRGTGTAPDGRRIAVEVERLQGGDTVNERATVFFGSIVDGDHWTARRIEWPDGRWFADEVGETPAEGPLVRIVGNELTIATGFEHETRGASLHGVLRAACPE